MLTLLKTLLGRAITAQYLDKFRQAAVGFLTAKGANTGTGNTSKLALSRAAYWHYCGVKYYRNVTGLSRIWISNGIAFIYDP